MSSLPILIASALLLAQVVAVPPQQDPLLQNRAPVNVNAPPGAPKAPSREVDRWFATAAAASSAAEIAMAQIELRRGRADEAKAYARKMISEHEGMMRALDPALRRVLGGTKAPELSPGDRLTLYRLEHAAPPDVDQTYVLAQVGGHLAALGAFQTEDEDGADPALLAAAKQWTPTIQSHLELAVDLVRHVGGATPFTTH